MGFHKVHGMRTVVYATPNQYTYQQYRKKFRSSRPKVFYKKGVLKNFTKFTGKHLCQRLFFNKVAGLRLYQKKRLWHRCFLVNFVKFLRTPFYTEHLWWLVLEIA